MGRLDELDLSLSLPKKKAKKRLKKEQRRLLALRLQLAGLVGSDESGRRCASCSRAGTPPARVARSSGSS